MIYSASLEDTICATDDPYNPGENNTCSFSNEGGDLVSVCVFDFPVAIAPYTTTSIIRLTLSTHSYVVHGRSVTVPTGSGCLTAPTCTEFTQQATWTGPPPRSVPSGPVGRPEEGTDPSRVEGHEEALTEVSSR